MPRRGERKAAAPAARGRRQGRSEDAESGAESDSAPDGASTQRAARSAEGALRPDPKVSSSALGAVLGVYAQLRTLNRLVRLSPFSVGHLMQSLCYREVNTLCGEIFMCMLRALTHRQTAEALHDTSGLYDQTTLCWLQLSGYTWPELLRRYLEAEHAAAENTVQAGAIWHALSLLEESPDFWSMSCARKVELLSFLCGHVFDDPAVRAIIEERTEYTDGDTDAVGHNSDYCAASGKAGGSLVRCHGCAMALREQHLERWQRPKPSKARRVAVQDGAAASETQWFCGLCVEKSWWTVRLTPLGADLTGCNYWFIGGHFWWQDPQCDLWAYLSLEDLEARMDAWAPARGKLEELEMAIQAHIPRHHHVDISLALQEAFTDQAQGYRSSYADGPTAAGTGGSQAGFGSTIEANAVPLSFDAISVGDEYDCLDPSPGWYSAQVVKKTASRLRMHFKGWSRRYDIWIPADEVGSRVATLGSRVGSDLTWVDQEVLNRRAQQGTSTVGGTRATTESKAHNGGEQAVAGHATDRATAVPTAAEAAGNTRSDMPDVAYGTVDMMVSGKLPPVATRPAELLPPCSELRTWTLESQAALWQQRFLFWKKQKLSTCQIACRQRSLWSGGSSDDLRIRLRYFEFDDSQLTAGEVLTQQEQTLVDALEDMPLFRNQFYRPPHDHTAFLHEKFQVRENSWPGRRKGGGGFEPDTALAFAVTFLLNLEHDLADVLRAKWRHTTRDRWVESVKQCQAAPDFIPLILQLEAEAVDDKWFCGSWRSGCGCLHDGHALSEDKLEAIFQPLLIMQTDALASLLPKKGKHRDRRGSKRKRSQGLEEIVELKSRKHSKSPGLYEECKFVNSAGLPVTVRCSMHPDPLLSLRDLVAMVYDDDDIIRANTTAQLVKPKLGANELRMHRFAQFGKASPAVPLSKLKTAMASIGDVETMTFLKDESGDLKRFEAALVAMTKRFQGTASLKISGHADGQGAEPVTPSVTQMVDAQVDAVLAKGVDQDGTTVKYLVRWDATGADDDTWELEADLVHSAPEQIKTFERKKRHTQIRRNELHQGTRRTDSNWWFDRQRLTVTDQMMYTSLPRDTKSVARSGGLKKQSGFIYDHDVAWISMRDAWLYQLTQSQGQLRSSFSSSSLSQIIVLLKCLSSSIAWADVRKATEERLERAKKERTQQGILSACEDALESTINKIEQAEADRQALCIDIQLVFDVLCSKKEPGTGRQQSLSFRQLPPRQPVAKNGHCNRGDMSHCESFYEMLINPISLAEIEQKIKAMKCQDGRPNSAAGYCDMESFEADVMLMLNNARVVCPPDSQTYDDAKSLQATLSSALNNVKKSARNGTKAQKKLRAQRSRRDAGEHKQNQAAVLEEWWRTHAATHDASASFVSCAEKQALADRVGWSLNNVERWFWEKRKTVRAGGIESIPAAPDDFEATETGQPKPASSTCQSPVSDQQDKSQKTDHQKGLAICRRAFKLLWDAQDETGRQRSMIFRTLPNKSADDENWRAAGRASCFYAAVGDQPPPLSLSLIEAKLESSNQVEENPAAPPGYQNLESFCDDVRWVFKGYQKYYANKDSVEWKDAQYLLELLETKMKKYRSEARLLGFCAPPTAVLRKRCITEVMQLLKDSTDDSARRPRSRVQQFLVLPDRAKLPEYYEQISQPIDISQIKGKLEKRAYKSWHPFAADLQLMFNNALAFNEPGSETFEDAAILQGILFDYEATRLPEPVKQESLPYNVKFVSLADLHKQRVAAMQQVIDHLCTLKDRRGNEMAALLMEPGESDETTSARPEMGFNAIKDRLTQVEADPAGGEYRVWKTFEADIFLVIARARKTNLLANAKAIEAAYKAQVQDIPVELLGFKPHTSSQQRVSGGRTTASKAGNVRKQVPKGPQNEIFAMLRMLQNLRHTAGSHVPPPESATASSEGDGRFLAMPFRAIPDPSQYPTATVEMFVESVDSPIILPTLIDKFKKCAYTRWSCFAADFRQMICDAKTYLYPPGSQESLDAIALSAAFDEQEQSVPVEIREKRATDKCTHQNKQPGKDTKGSDPETKEGKQGKENSVKTQAIENIIVGWNAIRNATYRPSSCAIDAGQDNDVQPCTEVAELATWFWSVSTAAGTSTTSESDRGHVAAVDDGILAPNLICLKYIRDRLPRPARVAENAKTSQYAQWCDFEQDVKRLFSNARAYPGSYGPGAPRACDADAGTNALVLQHADLLETVFVQFAATIPVELRAASVNGSGSPANTERVDGSGFATKAKRVKQSGSPAKTKRVKTSGHTVQTEGADADEAKVRSIQKQLDAAVCAAMSHLESLKDANGRRILHSLDAAIAEQTGSSAKWRHPFALVRQRLQQKPYRRWYCFVTDIVTICQATARAHPPGVQVCLDAAFVEAELNRYAASVPSSVKQAGATKSASSSPVDISPVNQPSQANIRKSAMLSAVDFLRSLSCPSSGRYLLSTE